MSEERIKIDDFLGYVELRTWFEYRLDHAVGMGCVKKFDRNGRLVSCVEKPTGCVIRFDAPKKTFWQRIFG